jgi:hypothetical protein
VNLKKQGFETLVNFFISKFFFLLFISKLYMHPVGLEPTTPPSNLLQREEVPFELLNACEPLKNKLLRL